MGDPRSEGLVGAAQVEEERHLLAQEPHVQRPSGGRARGLASR